MSKVLIVLMILLRALLYWIDLCSRVQEGGIRVWVHRESQEGDIGFIQWKSKKSPWDGAIVRYWNFKYVEYGKIEGLGFEVNEIT